MQWEKKDGVVGNPENAADLQNVNNVYVWAGCCNGDCSTLANFCQPNTAAAATCAAGAEGGTQGCSTCASGTCNVEPGSSGAITTVWDWINQVNAANFAGHSDWRLPSEGGCNTCFSGSSSSCSSCSAHELETILSSAYPCGMVPCIASIFGPTASNYYWSSTTYTPVPTNAWIVDFAGGYVSSAAEANGLYVRAVRSGS